VHLGGERLLREAFVMLARDLPSEGLARPPSWQDAREALVEVASAGLAKELEAFDDELGEFVAKADVSDPSLEASLLPEELSLTVVACGLAVVTSPNLKMSDVLYRQNYKIGQTNDKLVPRHGLPFVL